MRGCTLEAGGWTGILTVTPLIAPHFNCAAFFVFDNSESSEALQSQQARFQQRAGVLKIDTR